MDLTKLDQNNWLYISERATFTLKDVVAVFSCCTALRARVQRVLAIKWAERIVREGLALSVSPAVRWIHDNCTREVGRTTYIALRAILPAITRESDLSNYKGYPALPAGAICEALERGKSGHREFAASAWPLLSFAERELCVPTLNKFTNWDKDQRSTNCMYSELAVMGWAKTLKNPTETLAALIHSLSPEAIVCFVQAGADLSRIPEALHVAVKREDASEVVPVLLGLKAVVSHRDERNLNALEALLHERRTYDDKTLFLIEQLHAAGVPGLTDHALDLMAAQGSPDLIRLLHRLHAWTPGQRNAEGETSLHRICSKSFEFVSSVNPRLKLCTLRSEKLPNNHFEECVRLLISLGENIEALDNHGRSPLNSWIAGHAPCSTLKVLELFATLGADFNVVSRDGSSLLHEYTRRAYYSWESSVIEQEIAILTRLCRHALLEDKQGKRPIHYYANQLDQSFSMDVHPEIVTGLEKAGEVLSLTAQRSQMPLSALALTAAVLGRTALLRDLLTSAPSEVYKYGPRSDQKKSLLKRTVEAFQLESVRCILAVTGDRYLSVDGTRDDSLLNFYRTDSADKQLIAKQMTALILTAKGEQVTKDDLQQLHVFLNCGRFDLFKELLSVLPAHMQETYFSDNDYFDYLGMYALRDGNGDGVVEVCRYVHAANPKWIPKISELVHPKYPDLLDRLYAINPAWFQVDESVVYRVYDPFNDLCKQLYTRDSAQQEASIAAVEKFSRCDSRHRATLTWYEQRYGSDDANDTVFGLPAEHRERLYAAVLKPTAFKANHSTSPLVEIFTAFVKYGLSRTLWLELKPYIDAAFAAGEISQRDVRQLFHSPWTHTRATIGTAESTAVVCEIITYFCSKDREKTLFPNQDSSALYKIVHARQLPEAGHREFYEAVMTTLITCGHPVGLGDSCERTPLEEACSTGDVPAFEFLLKAGAVWKGKEERLLWLASVSRSFEMMVYVRNLVGVKGEADPSQPHQKKARHMF